MTSTAVRQSEAATRRAPAPRTTPTHATANGTAPKRTCVERARARRRKEERRGPTTTARPDEQRDERIRPPAGRPDGADTRSGRGASDRRTQSTRPCRTRRPSAAGGSRPEATPSAAPYARSRSQSSTVQRRMRREHLVLRELGSDAEPARRRLEPSGVSRCGCRARIQPSSAIAADERHEPAPRTPTPPSAGAPGRSRQRRERREDTPRRPRHATGRALRVGDDLVRRTRAASRRTRSLGPVVSASAGTTPSRAIAAGARARAARTR